MAFADTTPQGAASPSVRGAGLLARLVRMMENHPRMRRVQALNALSDADLARMGLTRQEAIMQVLGDRVYH
ncbi:uncharacterized protein Ga0609869_002578 [Rhodovulum iodosum]|uniref:DUF1127 domain-containing protein n=1 Tax=Rhodovulum iodosum TaxID=68291 RepID=A0ABV3XV84_9RHOB|nr:DUF1127 domain-containing protein [Rhodovulum robiginosum]RSK33589.1 DUF1127 domain-containing protein [Rhodovulum robiginosum]